MSTIGIVGTFIAAVIVVGIVVFLAVMREKIAPKTNELEAEEVHRKLVTDDVDDRTVEPVGRLEASEHVPSRSTVKAREQLDA